MSSIKISQCVILCLIVLLKKQNDWYFLVNNKQSRQEILVSVLLNFYLNNNQPENDVLPRAPLYMGPRVASWVLMKI